MDELLKALQAAFPKLMWEKNENGYRAAVPCGAIEAWTGDWGGTVVISDGGADVVRQRWLPGETVVGVARFHRKLQLAAKAVEVSDGR